jgi:hypothetical protein
MKLLSVLLLAMLAIACNPYKKLATTPPKSAKDSLRLAAKCQEAFPVVPQYIKGDEIIDTVFIEQVGSIDDIQEEPESEYTEDLGQEVPLIKEPVKAPARPAKKCSTIVITKTRVDLKVVQDSSGIFRERKAKEAALKEVARLNAKYENYGMYKFGFFAYPILLILAVILYFWARAGFKIPTFKLIR